MLRKRKGQSTLEYITVFVAIVAAIILFAFSRLKPAVESIVNVSAGKITSAATTFNAANIIARNRLGN